MLIHKLFGILKKGTPFACSVCVPKVWEEFTFESVLLIYLGPYYLKCYVMKMSYLAIVGAPMEQVFLHSIQIAPFPIAWLRSEERKRPEGCWMDHLPETKGGNEWQSQSISVHRDPSCLGMTFVSVTFLGRLMETEMHRVFGCFLQPILGPSAAWEHLRGLSSLSSWLYGVYYYSFLPDGDYDIFAG